MTSSEGFQHHFKICLLWFLHEAFTLISFAILKWDECLSVQPPPLVQIRVQFLLELEVNWWLDQNVNELEFELSILERRWNNPRSERLTSVWYVLDIDPLSALILRQFTQFLVNFIMNTSKCSREFPWTLYRKQKYITIVSTLFYTVVWSDYKFYMQMLFFYPHFCIKSKTSAYIRHLL